VEHPPRLPRLLRLPIQQLHDRGFHLDSRLDLRRGGFDSGVAPFAGDEALHAGLDGGFDERDVRFGGEIVEGADECVLALEGGDEGAVGCEVGSFDGEVGGEDGGGVGAAEDGEVEEAAGEEGGDDGGSDGASSLGRC
jgi:hypothetical protein